MNGWLLVDKPQNISSFGVVARVRKLLSEHTKAKVKVGHTGTLDPQATGLLVLAVGSYTKRVSQLLGSNKTYQVEITLGHISSTGDSEGEISAVSTKKPAPIEVKKVLQQHIGQQLQTPPAYSAIKVQGRRAYHLARTGQPVALQPRPITIYAITDTQYTYPVVIFSTTVSSGTYIRSLAQDIGHALGTGAYMSALRRTAVGAYSIDDANSLDSFTSQNVSQRLLKD